MVGCGLGSSSALEQKARKVEGTSLGLATKWTGLSFVEVLRSNPITAMKKVSSLGVLPSKLRDSLAKSCDFLPVVRFAKEDQRTAVNCYSLESPPLDPLDKDQNHRPLGEVPPKFEFEFQILELAYVETAANQFQIGHGPSCWKVYGLVFRVWPGLETHRYWLGPVSAETQSLPFEVSLWEDDGSAFYWAFFLGFWGSFSVFCQLLRVSFWCFLCILLVYQEAPLRFFNKSFLTYQKKDY
jgi:hypothetical protein